MLNYFLGIVTGLLVAVFITIINQRVAPKIKSKIANIGAEKAKIIDLND